jgi:hypothetical protein
MNEEDLMKLKAIIVLSAIVMAALMLSAPFSECPLQ